VEAALDVPSRTVSWTIASVDPNTGDAPADPLAGFLPPEDGSGRGDGELTFTVRPKEGLPDGTVIRNQARIVFDVNAPIATPEVTNTLDGTAPTSQVAPLETACAETFALHWSGSDAGGIADYTIWVADNGGPYTAWLMNTTDTSATFAGSRGHTYTFYSEAHDLAGQFEPPPAAPDATTTLIDPAGCDDGNACTDDSCGPTSVCVHAQRECFDGVSCLFDGTAPAACSGQPAKALASITKRVAAGRAKVGAAQAVAAGNRCKLKKVQHQLTAAGKVLDKARKAVERARRKKKRGLTADCATALATQIGAARAGVQGFARPSAACVPNCH
jgi:hypothetical protein